MNEEQAKAMGHLCAAVGEIYSMSAAMLADSRNDKHAANARFHISQACDAVTRFKEMSTPRLPRLHD